MGNSRELASPEDGCTQPIGITHLTATIRIGGHEGHREIGQGRRRVGTMEEDKKVSVANRWRGAGYDTSADNCGNLDIFRLAFLLKSTFM